MFMIEYNSQIYDYWFKIEHLGPRVFGSRGLSQKNRIPSVEIKIKMLLVLLLVC